MRLVAFIGKTAVVFAILGLWAVSATANFAHSFQLAGVSEWAYVIAAASAGADILKAGASFMISSAFRRRLWSVALAALLIWGSTTAWSIRSITGFMSNVMLQEQSTKTKSADNYQDLKRALEGEERYLTNLQGTTVTKKSDRISLSAEIDKQRGVVKKAREALANADPQEKNDGVTDLGEKFLPAWFSPELSRAITVGMFLLLLELGSNLGFFAFSALIGEKRERKSWFAWLWKAAEASEPVKLAEPSPITIEQPKPAPRAIAVAPTPAPTVSPVPLRAVQPAAMYAFPRRQNDPAVPHTKLQAFIAKLEVTHGKGARVATGEVQKAFEAFVGHGVDPSLLGRWLAPYGISRSKKRDKEGRRYYELPIAA